MLAAHLGLVAAAGKNPIEAGNRNVSLSLSGQVNRAILYTYDGEDSDFFNVDSDFSSTRFRIIGKYMHHDDFSVGATIEIQLESNSTADVSQDNKTTNGDDGDAISERKMELYFDSKQFGRLTLGQGSMASDGTSEVDLSGADLIIYSGPCDMAGGVKFRNDVTNVLTDTVVCDAFDNLDGLGRDDRIRLDSPVLYGFKGSFSWATDDRWDWALRYGSKFGDFSAAAAVGYSMRPDPVNHQINGSFSVLHSSGVNLAFAGGKRDVDAQDDPFFYYVKLGFTREFWSIGASSFAIDFYRGENFDQNNDEGTSVGAGFVQDLDAFGTELYIGLRNYDLDRDGMDLNNIFAVLTGARVKF